VPRYTLYPATGDVLALQVSVAECCTGATPVPVRETVAGELLALLTIEMFPLAVPPTLGPNCTDNVMFWEGVSVSGALPPVIA
jgi:hypothetical protein